MTKKQALEIGYQQLAVDYNVSPEVFLHPGITFTTPALNPGRRAYGTDMPFFEMVTVGHATVIMANKVLHTPLADWIKGVEHSHWLMEFPRLLALSKLLEPYGYELEQTFHQYIPARDFHTVIPPDGLALRRLEQEDIHYLFPNSSWPNALQSSVNPIRPQVLAIAAMDGQTTVAMAGASQDSPSMWQIGIDVLPEYRGKGLGSVLVQKLAHEIELRGAMPFYGTSLSNVHSQNIARNCGFYPAWVSVSTKKKVVM